MKVWRLTAPVSPSDLKPLRAGDKVLLTGTVYSARDAAHARIVECLRAGKPAPFLLPGAVIYYAGPSPTPPGRAMGSMGPTTSYRMDPYTPELVAAGARVTIGKGGRSAEVRKAMREHGAVYLGAVGGAGALLGTCIESAEIIAYEELGPEAVRKLTVRDFPAFVVNDLAGEDLYERGRAAFART